MLNIYNAKNKQQYLKEVAELTKDKKPFLKIYKKI